MTTTAPTTTLLLIDVQNDFHPGGSLAIPTANDDADRIASLISALTPDRVVATLDSHHALHIAHPEFWVHGTTSQHPDPFTVISASQVANGTWRPRDDLRIPLTAVDTTVFDGDVLMPDGSGGEGAKKLDLTKYCVEYCSRLEERGRFQLCIWPPHCLIGTEGHALVPAVRDALLEWSRGTGRSVEFVMKGQELLTEMYSAVCADVPVSATTSLNRNLVDSLVVDSDKLVVAGQAMSHCVNYTVRDIVEVATSGDNLTSGNKKERAAATARKIYVLTDCASAVPGFEGAVQQFLNDMRDAGVNLVTSSEMLSMKHGPTETAYLN
jgi:nicotinamidase/pyrazinamidase